MTRLPKKALLTLSALTLAMSASFSVIAEPMKSVAVTAIVEHPALDAVRDGVRNALNEAGYTEGENLKWQYQSAQGNTGTAAQIARKFIGDQADAIVAIGTPSAQAAVAGTKRIPIIFSAVTDPVEGQLTPSWEASGTNVTGVSDVLELSKQMELVKQVVPDAKRLGMVFNPGEANSVAVVTALKEILPAYDLTLVEAAAPRSVDVGTAARSLVGKVDVIYTNTDNNVVSAYEALVKVGNDTSTPLIASDTDSVKRGAIAALGVNYLDLGEQTGRIVVRILEGENPGDIKPQTSENVQLFVNLSAAEKQGVTLSQELIDSAAEVIR
ncbi:MAG TPA: ABC transporter substrate-binding protein [Thiopseudomonas sp.]|nr:ABC transporter substrate-binding protein [Thiopseudomonas sp.]